MNITPNEKAKSMIAKYYSNLTDVLMNDEAQEFAITCSLLCVEEILKAREAGKTGVILDKEYWEEVRHELEQM
jgi:hypothetical protein